ncbi:hypothetical protein ASG52_03890 [Methylobacterium sp. Leaf456]|uniref:hypothetical protein n=1 Tax=Methylobacterium sp. Leaf456 TaxID=1736382 RepID=UPI0006F6654E|nr:hypothetical protein [Methylobacterium sp. Leaf456]KQT57209.1 hypothetical protein ASG52_03890 [Methylobacterium sp. Leaf456]
MGGSTIAAAKTVTGRLYAVESDEAWIAKVAETIGDSAAERKLLYVDIGPTKKWGVPTTDICRDNFPKYSGAIAESGIDDFDLCLVDGRFRVACFLQALRHLRRGSVVGIHDYRSRRKYHVAEQFGRIIAEAEDLTFFVHKPDLDKTALQDALDRYLYVHD